MIEEGIDLDGYLLVDKDLKEYTICNVMYRSLKEWEGKNYEQIRGYIIIEK